MQRKFRLTRSVDIERVRREGRSYAHPLLVLVVNPNPEGDLRVAVTAGRAVGGAVQRNRAKRRLRGALQPWLAHLPPGHDLLLIARPPLLNQDPPALRQALANCLQRAGLLDNQP